MTSTQTTELRAIATEVEETSGGMHWLYGELRKVLTDMLNIAAGEGQADPRLDKLRTALETTGTLAADIRGQQRLLVARLQAAASEGAAEPSAN